VKFAFITSANSPSMQGYYLNVTINKDFYFGILDHFKTNLEPLYNNIDQFIYFYNYLIDLINKKYSDFTMVLCNSNFYVNLINYMSYYNLFSINQLILDYTFNSMFFVVKLIEFFFFSIYEILKEIYENYIDYYLIFFIGDSWKFLFHWNLAISSVTSYYINDNIRVSYVNEIRVFKRKIPFEFYTF
jgi:hypothetical protein